jgi:hypothetical protein
MQPMTQHQASVALALLSAIILDELRSDIHKPLVNQGVSVDDGSLPSALNLEVTCGAPGRTRTDMPRGGGF